MNLEQGSLKNLTHNNKTPVDVALARMKVETTDPKESSCHIDQNSTGMMNSRCCSQNETDPYVMGDNLNPNISENLKIKNSFQEAKANSSNSTLHLLEQQKLRCHQIPEQAQHYDIGPLLSRMDKHESRKRPDVNGLSIEGRNCKPHASANLLRPSESPPTTIDDPVFHHTHTSISKRPRSDSLSSAHDSPVDEKSFSEDEGPPQLSCSLKRLSREELERIIMGHMAGYFSTYKPYVDVERELDNFKEQVERLRQKNNLLSKEVADLRIVIKSFVTQSAIQFERPTKRYRSVGVQVKALRSFDNSKLEENGFQAFSAEKKNEGSRSVPQNHETTASHHPQFERYGELSSVASQSRTNTPQKEFPDIERINGREHSKRKKTEEAKAEDDDLMVMFVKPSNSSQSGDSGAEHTSIPSSSSSKTLDHPMESIVPKPVVTVTKTAENSIPAIRIAWKISEEPCYAKVASYSVFLLKETKNGFGEKWNSISGDISRMSCTLRVGRADKFRKSFQFKVRATDVHGRPGPFSDIVVATFP
ncbi:hypothetical protein GHT06_022028 [Daphnia sinensis]|uniref:Activating transcription factor 7-interacting protein Fn3 domain-containing protein n=1 Tax=Daphnia sinensis TaxID=1820382 RepID=A0AAD5KHV8_9CRUS|nr:hypothetical protein GHT06_022028 [Daphnia sinensis]